MTKRCKNCGWPNDDNNVKCEKCGASLEEASSPNYPSARPSYQQTVSESNAGGEHLRKTVSESQFFGKEEEQQSPIQDYQSREAQPSPNGEINCPSCGYPAREGSKVCMNCGASLLGSVEAGPSEMSKKCPNCGCMNEEGANFCSKCGHDLTQNSSGHPVSHSHHPRGGTYNPWMKPENNSFCTLKPVAWVGENMVFQPQSYSGESIVLNRANTDPNNQTITTTEQAELTFEDGEWYIVDRSAQHTTYVLAAQKIKLHKGDIIVLGNRLFEFN